jgi:hypothetical protein
LKHHPEVDLVGAWAIVFSKDGIPLGKRAGAERHEEICTRPGAGFPLIHPTYLGRIGFFREFGYCPSAVRCEDQDLLLRSFETRVGNSNKMRAQDQDLLLRSYRGARFANVPEILLGYREDRLDLKKLLASRYYFMGSVRTELLRQGRPFVAARAAAAQVLKATADLVAIGTGLNHKLLRHRARPVTEPERHRWRDVWASLQTT